MTTLNKYVEFIIFVTSVIIVGIPEGLTLCFEFGWSRILNKLNDCGLQTTNPNCCEVYGNINELICTKEGFLTQGFMEVESSLLHN